MSTNMANQGQSESDPAVGYRRPPISGQFKKGTSGNRKGRPPGRPNVATLHKALFNEPVKVREGGKSRVIPAGQAILLLQTVKAARGDEHSLFAVMDILDMTGRTNEITDEERAKRALHLPLPLDQQEWDLLYTQARQKDRERYRMQIEMDPGQFAKPEDVTPTVVVPAFIQHGDRLALERKFDEALAAYRQELTACKVDLTADSNDTNAQARFRRAVARIALMADTLLLASEFGRAIDFAEEALAEGSTPFWINETMPFCETNLTTGTIWISVIRAHAWMFTGQIEAARAFYQAFKGNARLMITSWESAVLRDFVRLRKAGHSHPLMEEIEKRYRAEGWSTGIGNIKATLPQMKADEVIHLRSHSDDIKMGDRLRDHGNPHEAVAVYMRNLKKWHQNVQTDQSRTDWKQNLDMAADRIADAIRHLFNSGRFIYSLEYATSALALAPHHLPLQAVKACALLLRGEHDDAARTLFMRYCGKAVDGKRWEELITSQFSELRKIGCSRQLMDEIERRFAGLELSPFAEVDDTAHNQKAEYPNAALIVASDIQSAEALEEQGLLEEALVVYGRCLKECNTKIEKFSIGVYNNRAIDDRVAVSDKLASLATGFLMERNFAKALEAIDLALTGNHTHVLNIWRAHALMFLDRADDARAIYQSYRGQQVSGQSGTAFILAEFASLRKQGLDHPLMNEIESLFVARGIFR